ncbi:MAG: peptide chain release factor N(5)-glutamine methyltransferase [Proteobacteria bacterium]|nr:peptide chain release factor N(5)-glutamine methyltransferase [Pseudomonadota bacterium]
MQALKEQVLSILRASAHSKSPEAECERILFYVLREKRASIQELGDLARMSIQPDESERVRVIKIAQERSEGRPLQHLLGFQYFYSHDYRVDASTLIPRPETEILIDETIRATQARFGARPFRFAELGLGTGILSCEILSHFPEAVGMASECSEGAIDLARRNLREVAGEQGPRRLKILKTRPSDGFEVFAPEGPFELVLSNPPYVSRSDEIDTEVLTHEPGSALFPESDPSFFYWNFLAHASALLAPGGLGFFEIPHERAEEIEQRFLQSGLGDVRLVPDLTGRPRVLVFEARNQENDFGKTQNHR